MVKSLLRFSGFLGVGVIAAGCTSREPDLWRNGRGFVRLEPGEIQSIGSDTQLEGGDSGEEPETLVETGDSAESFPAEHYARQAMSREELAYALRPIVGDGKGNTYIAQEPAYDIADAILAMSPDDEFLVDGQSVEVPDDKSTQAIFGADNRTIAPNSNPYRWMVHFSTHCSGVFIGWHTIVTAAHCVFDPATDDWKVPITLTVNRQGPNSSGLGQIYLLHENVGGGISIPAGFDDNGAGNRAWDFAVIDLTGHAVSPSGWNGYWVNYGGSSLKLYGYPRPGPGGTLCPGKTVGAWLCGMSGNGEINDFRLESWDIDSSIGQSGGPWLANTNHTVGVHTGYREYHDLFKCGLDSCKRAYSRRLDSVFWNFIVAESADW